MQIPMHKNQSVDVHQFAMIPKADIPRSSFDREHTHKTTFDSGYLIPIYVDEVLPGDTFNLRMTAFVRLATPLFPLMDNLTLETFFFFVPNRLVWTNFVKMMGEQLNPGDSISYTTPQQVSPAGGYAANSLQDYMGLPTVGQLGGGNTFSHSALPLRAYNLIWREWFRDESLQNSPVVDTGDGPDNVDNYTLLKRGKRKDYFTGALPWPQKGATAVSLPLGTTAPVYGTGKALGLTDGTVTGGMGYNGVALQSFDALYNTNVGTATSGGNTMGQKALGVVTTGTSGLYADLSTATAATLS